MKMQSDYDTWLEAPYYDETPERPERDPDDARDADLDDRPSREDVDDDA